MTNDQHSTKKKKGNTPPRNAARVFPQWSSEIECRLSRFYAVAVKVPEPETLTPPPKAVDGKLQVPLMTLPVDVGAP